MSRLPIISGIGSVTPYGPLAGLVSCDALQPSAITAWETAEPRRAFVVEPFRAASIVPGVKTRRLDRLSTWALVASSLALRDAGVNLAQVDRSRVAVFFATGLGCVELTEAFYQSASANGWAGTDPITFPETLTNSPASHVALFHDLRGPNLTISSKCFAAESALLQAASLLRHGQAQLAIVLAGDTLTRAVYEWYETAGLLSSTCFGDDSSPEGFVPAEGLVAMVLEPAGRQAARAYAALGAGRWATGGDARKGAEELFGETRANFVFCAGNGAPCDSTPELCLARGLGGDAATVYPAQPVAAGMGEAGGLLHLLLALSKQPGAGEALLVAESAHCGYAALRLEIF
jgi:3-oxoacyl-(acyl-carrier-protein) synthase